MGLKLAIFGQAAFGREVTERLAAAGHDIVGVYTPPDQGRPDPLAQLAEERAWPLFQVKYFRRKGGVAIPSRVEQYLSLGADLNVMPFTTAILPPEITDVAPHGSLCFHPSLLPAYRGGNALAWQIILGAKEAGVSVFKVDAGVDTGPLVVQHGGVEISPDDTVTSLYFQKLYPLGVEAMVEAVDAVADGSARYREQGQAGASFQGLVGEDEARIDWTRPADEIDRLIRGCDPSPGAHATLGDETVRLFASRLKAGDPGAPAGRVLGCEGGLLQIAATGGTLEVAKVRVGAAKKGPAGESGLSGGEQLR